MAERRSAELMSALSQVAPGRPLREGLDRILKAGMGALIVIGDGPEVLNISSGGFLVNAAFSPQRLSELAKTDGAIVLTPDATYIARANVHLVPNPNVPTEETGTRHRTAERVARSIGVPCISVSEDMAVVTVYTSHDRYQLEPIPSILSRCNQALQTLERYKSRLDEESTSLTALEVEDQVMLRDVVSLLQRAELVARISEEIEQYLVELGTDGRLVGLQLRELMAGVEDERRLVVLDYLQPDASWDLEQAIETLSEIGVEDLLDQEAVAQALHLAGHTDDLDSSIQPAGHRMLARIPRLPEGMAEQLVSHCGTLEKLSRSTVEELSAIPGVSEHMARTVKDALARIAESSILDRYS
ncbi:MAG: DNA integrity scanning diadenylate cyclase DisA [Microthrixaceae bacterium]|nr:DNA integrity scanning diadenylate cyclase DisA [Microthrixaceae bacterium]MCO5318887.1 DNA integrity scanning diadenylate cyclase DisA [Microthrixaceae bacterium]